jgi:hypothetical protein
MFDFNLRVLTEEELQELFIACSQRQELLVKQFEADAKKSLPTREIERLIGLWAGIRRGVDSDTPSMLAQISKARIDYKLADREEAEDRRRERLRKQLESGTRDMFEGEVMEPSPVRDGNARMNGDGRRREYPVHTDPNPRAPVPAAALPPAQLPGVPDVDGKNDYEICEALKGWGVSQRLHVVATLPHGERLVAPLGIALEAYATLGADEIEDSPMHERVLRDRFLAGRADPELALQLLRDEPREGIPIFWPSGEPDDAAEVLDSAIFHVADMDPEGDPWPAQEVKSALLEVGYDVEISTIEAWSSSARGRAAEWTRMVLAGVESETPAFLSFLGISPTHLAQLQAEAEGTAATESQPEPAAVAVELGPDPVKLAAAQAHDSYGWLVGAPPSDTNWKHALDKAPVEVLQAALLGMRGEDGEPRKGNKTRVEKIEVRLRKLGAPLEFTAREEPAEIVVVGESTSVKLGRDPLPVPPVPNLVADAASAIEREIAAGVRCASCGQHGDQVGEITAADASFGPAGYCQSCGGWAGPVFDDVPESSCVACGCVDSEACEGGCTWLWRAEGNRGRCDAEPCLEDLAGLESGHGKREHKLLVDALLTRLPGAVARWRERAQTGLTMAGLRSAILDEFIFDDPHEGPERGQVSGYQNQHEIHELETDVGIVAYANRPALARGKPYPMLWLDVEPSRRTDTTALRGARLLTWVRTLYGIPNPITALVPDTGAAPAAAPPQEENRDGSGRPEPAPTVGAAQRQKRDEILASLALALETGKHPISPSQVEDLLRRSIDGSTRRVEGGRSVGAFDSWCNEHRIRPVSSKFEELRAAAEALRRFGLLDLVLQRAGELPTPPIGAADLVEYRATGAGRLADSAADGDAEVLRLEFRELHRDVPLQIIRGWTAEVRAEAREWIDAGAPGAPGSPDFPPCLDELHWHPHPSRRGMQVASVSPMATTH